MNGPVGLCFKKKWIGITEIGVLMTDEYFYQANPPFWGEADSAVGWRARLVHVIQAQVWLQVRISAEEKLYPGVNMCTNSILPQVLQMRL